jgi:hypothetical protein
VFVPLVMLPRDDLREAADEVQKRIAVRPGELPWAQVGRPAQRGGLALAA